MIWNRLPALKCLVIISFCLEVMHAVKAEPLRLTTGDDFPPYTGAELPEGGLASAIVIAAFAWMNQEVALEYRPWKRGYEETKAGQYLATYPYVKSRDRLVDFHFSDPIFQYERILFERRHPNASQWPDTLRGERLCLPVGYEVPSVIEDRVIKGTLILIKPSDMDACFKQLLRNRTDYVLSDRILGQSIASHHFGAAPQQLTMIEPPVSKQSAHLIIAKNQPDAIKIIADFNRALIALRADGTLDHLVALPSEQSSKPVSK